MACNDLPQPVTLSWDRLVHSQPQLRLDFLELRLHAVAPGLTLKLEESPARLTADEGEAQKSEGVRSTDTAFLAIARRVAAELRPQTSDTQREFARDSLLEGSGFELLVP